MNDILKTYMERFRENRHTLRRYTAFVLALAMITTLFVNWQLHGVGISMTAQYQCGEEEHTHTADCYERILICGYKEGDLENASEIAAAEASAEEEIMPLELEPQIEFVPHEHTADCYTEVQTLTCMEEEHIHGDAYSASGADILTPSVVSPAAEPQTTTVTDALPVETVGIVSEVDSDAGTLTVISGDVDGKVAEVALMYWPWWMLPPPSTPASCLPSPPAARTVCLHWRRGRPILITL